MSIAEVAVLLAEIQVGDNRNVDELTIAYWHNTIGDLALEAAQTALRRFRRERPGVYLEPGHLVELAGVVDEVPDPVHRDFTREYVQAEVRKVLAVMGKTEADYDRSPEIRALVAGRMELAAIEAGTDQEDEDA
jgi:hypothetical protein